MPEHEPVITGAPDPRLEAYLDAVTAALDLPAPDRREVRDEIRAYVDDLRTGLEAGGMSREQAFDEAVRRLGPAGVLGREMARVRQTRRALLAAVGGATWAAGGAAFRGLIVGFALVLVLVIGVVVLVAASARLAGITLATDGFGAASGTALAAGAFGFAAWQAGRAFVSAAARRSHRTADRVRAWAAVIGGIVTAWLTLVWFHAAQSEASVAMLALVPVVFVGAALTGTDRPVEQSRQARRATLALLAILVIAIPGLGLAVGGTVQTRLSAVGTTTYGSMEELLAAQGFDLPGRYVADPPELGDVMMSIDNGVANVVVPIAAAVTARWHDLRVELWTATASGAQIDRAHPVPFAAGPMRIESDLLVGSVRTDGMRGVSQWWAVLTGLAADGGRDMVLNLGGGNSTFSGSAMDWLTAP